MKKLSVCIYADSTGLFSESERNHENLTDMDFPEEIVRKWYEAHKKELDEETAYELRKPIEECTFEDWYNEISWAGDTDGLYDFSVENGHKPTFGFDKHTYVFYRDDCNFKTIVFEGDYDECREFGRENDWEYDGYELEVAE